MVRRRERALTTTQMPSFYEHGSKSRDTVRPLSSRPDSVVTAYDVSLQSSRGETYGSTVDTPCSYVSKDSSRPLESATDGAVVVILQADHQRRRCSMLTKDCRGFHKSLAVGVKSDRLVELSSASDFTTMSRWAARNIRHLVSPCKLLLARRQCPGTLYCLSFRRGELARVSNGRNRESGRRTPPVWK